MQQVINSRFMHQLLASDDVRPLHRSSPFTELADVTRASLKLFIHLGAYLAQLALCGLHTY